MPDDLKGAIGRRIRATREATPRKGKSAGTKARRSSHLTIDELADAAEISPRYLAKLERGEHLPPLDTLASIAKALGVPMDRLVAEPRSKKAAEHEQALAELIAVAGKQDVAVIRKLVRTLAIWIEK